ncbi:hypothetical protein U0E10_25720 [Burkholderia ubonensis]|uniref:hypothetical protein n=1 Tax=Burkholderia ubonensis TaxID=101571 RepID=UPI002AB5C4D1|nr:hypothetical protein [Burkholderia ubonensis]MDY7791296.1 hypothetical protein [Burkholderia ubonensis]
MSSIAFDSAGRSRPDPSGGAVVRLALAFAAATNGLILSPFLVAAVMTRFRLDDGAATALISVEILGIAISCSAAAAPDRARGPAVHAGGCARCDRRPGAQRRRARHRVGRRRASPAGAPGGVGHPLR